nr:putative glycosyl transferase-like protein [Trypanosoma vivax Y486]
MHRTTNCYVVSHRGARRLLDSCFPVTYQLDTMMTLNVVHEVQYSGVPRVAVPECYTLQPPLVVQATRMGSDIQDKSGKSCEEELLEEKGRCKAAGWCDDNSEAL